jgi:hypothetical protein
MGVPSVHNQTTSSPAPGRGLLAGEKAAPPNTGWGCRSAIAFLVKSDQVAAFLIQVRVVIASDLAGQPCRQTATTARREDPSIQTSA